MVKIWWMSLALLFPINLTLWIWASRISRQDQNLGCVRTASWRKTQRLLALGYVLGCGFRSVFPRVDVQRICLYDSWISSIFLGRSIATVAELCFAAQWAWLLREYTRESKSHRFAKSVAFIIVPLILIAEISSWASVITTDFLGHVIEESIWGFTALLTTLAFIQIFKSFDSSGRRWIALGIASGAVYVFYMSTVDVPLYVSRWRADMIAGHVSLRFSQGLEASLFERIVTFSISDWVAEIPWMTGYFSFAVWLSIAFINAPSIARTPETQPAA